MERSSNRDDISIIRDIFAKPLIDRKVEDLKSNCEECGKVKRFCDKCESEYVFYRGAYLSNLPIAKAKVCAETELDEIDVQEVKLATSKPSENDSGAPHDKSSFKLYEEVLDPYWRKHVEILSEGTSLFFLGTNHLGKTTAGVYLAMKYLRLGRSVHYVTFPQLHRLHTRSYDEADVALLMDAIQDVDLLIVDELGKETVHSESVLRLADTYLKFREENLRPTIIITNMTKTQLWSDVKDGGYGPSFLSMLLQRYWMYRFKPSGVNLRLKYRQKRPF
jgi:DNA replication protein DnaC